MRKSYTSLPPVGCGSLNPCWHLLAKNISYLHVVSLHPLVKTVLRQARRLLCLFHRKKPLRMLAHLAQQTCNYHWRPPNCILTINNFCPACLLLRPKCTHTHTHTDRPTNTHRTTQSERERERHRERQRQRQQKESHTDKHGVLKLSRTVSSVGPKSSVPAFQEFQLLTHLQLPQHLRAQLGLRPELSLASNQKEGLFLRWQWEVPGTYRWPRSRCCCLRSVLVWMFMRNRTAERPALLRLAPLVAAGNIPLHLGSSHRWH